MANLVDYTDNSQPQQSLIDMTARPRVVIDTSDFDKPKLENADAIAGNSNTSTVQHIVDRLFGLNGQDRYQLWPEKVVREGLSAAHDAMTGEIPQYTIDPKTGDIHTSPQMIEGAQAISALAGTGGLGGVGSEAGTALGSTPFLRPALKYGEKIYKGKPGQQHLDVIPNDLYPTFQKQAMNGEDISNFNFGFLNHKGQFMNREDALKYAVDNGLVEPQAAQFGALTSTLMADSSKPGTAIEAMANTNKPFYSAVENAVAAAKQPTADAQQWLGFLKNQPGVKQEELQHLGLDKLQGPISKDDLLKAVQEGQPQINEVIKGGVSKEDIYKILNKKYPNVDKFSKNWDKYYNEELKNYKNFNPPKYQKYQLPGGKNYREMLLTLPPVKTKLEQYKVIRPDGHVDSTYANAESANVRAQAIGGNVKQAETLDLNGGYKSSHWDEPNVLTHIRMNDRDINGKKTLHVEEVQSDWHQAGRKYGYKSELENLEKQRNSLPEHDFDNRSVLNSKIGNIRTFGVPDAPFKKTWDELALKHIIDHAVKNGYDQISWTPGEAQAARYDLSKQIDSLYYNPETKHLFARNNDGSPINKMNVEPEDLPNFVGKEAADKILNTKDREKFVGGEYNTLRNADLKVGGEGMKAFYDKMLVDKMNAIGKKFGGGKVGKSEIGTGKIENVRKGLGMQAKEGKQPIHTFPITPELRNQVMTKGLPLFSMGLPIYTPVSHNPFKDKAQ